MSTTGISPIIGDNSIRAYGFQQVGTCGLLNEATASVPNRPAARWDLDVEWTKSANILVKVEVVNIGGDTIGIKFQDAAAADYSADNDVFDANFADVAFSNGTLVPWGRMTFNLNVTKQFLQLIRDDAVSNTAKAQLKIIVSSPVPISNMVER